MNGKKFTNKDPFYCVICATKYDNSSNRPYCLMPCGHTYCRICIEKNANECPVCEVTCNQYIPDYGLLDQITGVKGMSLSERNFASFQNRAKEAVPKNDEPAVVVSNSVYGGRRSRPSSKQQAVQNEHIVAQRTPEKQSKSSLSEIKNQRLNPSRLGNADKSSAPEESGVITKETVKTLKTGSLEQKLNAAQQIRALVSKEINENIDLVINLDLLPVFVDLLGAANKSSNADLTLVNSLVFETLWILTNIASGTSAQTRAVIDSDAIPIVVDLLRDNASASPDVLEQAVWLVGNIAGDGSASRDLLLDHNLLEPLLKLIVNPNNRISLIRNSVWCLANLCRGRDSNQVKLERIEPALKVLSDLLYHEDVDVLTDACWALSYLMTGSSARIRAIASRIDLARLAKLLIDQSTSVINAVLTIFGNLVFNDQEESAERSSKAAELVSLNLIEYLYDLLENSNTTVRKQTCQLISQLLTEEYAELNTVFQSKLISKLVSAIKNYHSNVQNEATAILLYLLSNCRADHYEYFVHQNLVSALCGLLSFEDNKLVENALTILENLLDYGQRGRTKEHIRENDQVNIVANMISDCYGTERIQYLQSFEDESVSSLATGIITKYFFLDQLLGYYENGEGGPDDEDDDEEENDDLDQGEELFDDEESDNDRLYDNYADSSIDD